jgi:serine protease AprX
LQENLVRRANPGLTKQCKEAPLRSLSSFFATLVLITGLAPVAHADPVTPAPVEASLLDARGVGSAFVHAREGRFDDALSAATTVGLDVAQRYEEIGVFHVLGTPASFRALSLIPAVEAIEANRAVHVFTDSSHVATRSEALYTGAVNATSYDGSGVGVAVIDTGVDGTIPALKPALGRGSNFKILCPIPGAVVRAATLSFSACPVDTVTVEMEDTDTIALGGHGTHVAGIIAGAETCIGNQDPATGCTRAVRGAAPGSALYGIGAGALLSVDNAMDGLEWVLDNHDAVSPAIKIVNNSWGTAYEEYDDPDSGPEFFFEDGYRIHRAIWKMQEALIDENVTLVFAAGNSGGGVGAAPSTMAQCINPTPGVICVSNYNDLDTGSRSGNIDASSSRGQRSDPKTWPDVAAPGTNIISTCRPSLPLCAVGSQINDEYFAMSGTSMAAPHVAGIVAQMLQADPTLTPAGIENILEDTAHKFEWGSPYGRYIDATNPDDESSFEKGHGLVDALAAVTGALSPPTPPATADPVLYAASGTILGQAATSFFFEPSVASNASITRHAFEASCLTSVPPLDAYVFEVPSVYADGSKLITASGSNPLGLWGFHMWFYTADCKRNGGYMGSFFGDVSGMLAKNTRYVVVTNHFGAVTTAGIAIQPPPLFFTDDSLSSAQYSDPLGVGARVTAVDENPLAGEPLRFTLEGAATQTWDSVTDGRGAARPTDPISVAPGVYTLTVTYRGTNPLLQGASITKSFEVVAEATSLTLTDSGKGSKRTLTATLLDDDLTPVAGRTVTFYSGGVAIGSSSTDSAGMATLSVPPHQRASTTVFGATFCTDGLYATATTSTGTTACL